MPHEKTRRCEPAPSPLIVRMHPNVRRDLAGLGQLDHVQRSARDVRMRQRAITRDPEGHSRWPSTGLAPISHPAPAQSASTAPSTPVTSRTKNMFGKALVCNAPSSPLAWSFNKHQGTNKSLRLGHTTAVFIESQTGTPELVYCRRALVDTLKPHCCWGPNGVSVWVWQGGASRIGRELAGGQPLSLSSKSCR
jgi:hypothetical protein